MNNNFKREARYVVLKNADIMQCLTVNELIELRRIQAKAVAHRAKLGKPWLDCVVVESDWPEYEPTWRAIEARVTGTQNVPSVPEGFSREDLEAVADGLDGYEKTVNVGNVTGGGDDHLESTTAYAARFIRAMLAAPETKP